MENVAGPSDSLLYGTSPLLPREVPRFVLINFNPNTLSRESLLPLDLLLSGKVIG